MLLLLTDNAWRARIPGVAHAVCLGGPEGRQIGRRAGSRQAGGRQCNCLLVCSRVSAPDQLLHNCHTSPGQPSSPTHLAQLTLNQRCCAQLSADDPSGRWRQAQQALADNPRASRLAAVGVLGAELLALAAASALQAIYQQAYDAWMDDREVRWRA